MSDTGRTTTGTTKSVGDRVSRQIDSLYEPTKVELKAKHTFYHRLKHGVWSGTPQSEWSQSFVQKVIGSTTGISKWGDPAFKAWFTNEQSYEETKLASLEGAMQVINEIIHNQTEKASDRLKAAEMALKLNKAFDEAKDTQSKGEFSQAELDALEASGIDLKLVTGKRP